MPGYVSRWQPNWRWEEKERVFWGASPHEIGSCIHTLIYWGNHTPALCTGLGVGFWKKKKSPIPPQNPFSLLPCTFFPLKLKMCFFLMCTCTQCLVFPAPSLSLFCRKVRKIAFATDFLPQAKPTRAWWFGAPQGYLISPICTLIDTGPWGTEWTW